MTTHIRPMNSADKPEVMAILRVTTEFKPFEVDVAEEVIDSYLHDPSCSGYHILVAKVDRHVMGYICFGHTPLTEGTWDVYWVAVTPDKKGQGIGKALMASAEDKIKEAQGRLVLVETSSKPNYEMTRNFYHNRGYDIICRIPDFYAPGDDEVVFQKRLR